MTYLQDFQAYIAFLRDYLETPWTQYTLPWKGEEVVVKVTPDALIQLLLTCLALNVVFKTVNRNRKGWALNIVKKTMGFSIYLIKGLFIKCTLDVLLIMNSVYGWQQWKGGGTKKANQPVRVTTLRPALFLGIYALAIVIALGLGFVYSRYTAQKKPYLDGLHAVMSLLNYYFLAKKKREAWLFSLTGQIAYIYVCYDQKMIFLLKYILYTILSMRGFYRWHKAYAQERDYVEAV